MARKFIISRYGRKMRVEEMVAHNLPEDPARRISALLKPVVFDWWLAQQKDTRDCFSHAHWGPIAIFLRDVAKLDVWVFDGLYRATDRVSGKVTSGKLPSWARKFVKAFDASGEEQVLGARRVWKKYKRSL